MSVVVPCRSCDAPVIWATHVRTGKRAPIDAEPDNRGNVILTGTTYTVEANADRRAALVLEGVELRTNHFQTCADAERWSFKK